MVRRPISGWTYAATGDTSPWTSIDRRFDAKAESAVGLCGALRTAKQRWGRARVACLSAATSWSHEQPAEPVGFSYAKVGPGAESGVLRSAWGLLEHGAADAVWVRSQHAEFLVERTGESVVALHPGEHTSSDFLLEPEQRSVIMAIVVGAAIVELGLRCAPGAVEPERVSVRAKRNNWRLELRP